MSADSRPARLTMSSAMLDFSSTESKLSAVTSIWIVLVLMMKDMTEVDVVVLWTQYLV